MTDANVEAKVKARFRAKINANGLRRRQPAIPPPVRKLQIYTLDPSADTRMDLIMLSRSVLSVPWEDLEPGPHGEYVSVVDHDPASGCYYLPVDLEDHLATDGLAPSAGDPQFHQQMVYAITMNTIRTFEDVLGRSVLWTDRKKDDEGGYITNNEDRYVQRLRLFPHAMRNDNAYYSPQKKSILFGYYSATPDDVTDTMPGGVSFTCLSHDIIVHEVTHAILDSIHPKLLHTSNHDMLAFHEAFSDIVAIFQHFSLPDLLLNEIINTRGNLRNDNLLANLACEFARSTGRGDTLRTALGSYQDGVRKKPATPAINTLFKPHERGGILVAAIFDAFLMIYEEQVKDLRRIATNGTGVLPDGDIHPDLARRFAREAVKISQRVLRICIRAIDYIPPVDITFGDFLRAVITADRDAVPNDRYHYRVAFLESFREKGIYPLDVRTLSEESLRWRRIDEINSDEQWLTNSRFFPPKAILRTMVLDHPISEATVTEIQVKSAAMREELKQSDKDGFALSVLDELTQYYIDSIWTNRRSTDTNADERTTSRRYEHRFSRFNAMFIHLWLSVIFLDKKLHRIHDKLKKDLGIGTGEANQSKFEILSIRRIVRPKPDGISKVELFVSVAMRRIVKLKDEDGTTMRDASGDDIRFFFRSGCTLIVDPDVGRIRYAIKKNHLDFIFTDDQNNRLERQQAYYREQIALYGEDAIIRFGLTEAANEIRAGLEAFSLVHDHTAD